LFRLSATQRHATFWSSTTYQVIDNVSVVGIDFEDTRRSFSAQQRSVTATVADSRWRAADVQHIDTVAHANRAGLLEHLTMISTTIRDISELAVRFGVALLVDVGQISQRIDLLRRLLCNN
jgi:hypothetical protein